MTALRLVQISDLHLFGDPSGKLLGLTTRLSFESVLERALDKDTGAPPASLVLTGDLVHDESSEGYAYLAGVLRSTGVLAYCIPGNHDRRDLMETHLGGSAVGAVAGRRLGNWHLLFADATIPGQDSGRLGYDQMRCLDALLSAEPVPTLLFLHQHPVPIGSAWMDTMGVSNTAELLALCRRHSHLRALVCGHIHQELDMDFGGVRVLGAPSTCVQFLPGSADFALDNRPPGYRELRLYQNGYFETWVERLDDYREPLDLGAGGY